jgi:hypothetical protein
VAEDVRSREVTGWRVLARSAGEVVVASGGLVIGTQDVRSGGTSMAYRVPGGLGHLAWGWRCAPVVRSLERLVCVSRLIVLDKSGSGFAVSVGGVATLEERVGDVVGSDLLLRVS